VSIITISRGSYSYGTRIAERVAERLGYACIGRDVLLEASSEFSLPEFKLLRALDTPPSILDRLAYGKERYIAYIQAALLKRLQVDNTVYHGFAGHFFVKDISHALKIRIIATLEDRVKLLIERDGISRKDALGRIRKIDKERRKWSKHFYGIDIWDPDLYDLVIHIENISVDHAANIICHTIDNERFKTTPESQRALDDLAIASRVKATLIEMKPDIEVTARDGVVHVRTQALDLRESELWKSMQAAAEKIQGVKEIKIDIFPITPYSEF
jgi:cytidylate kinase